MKVPGIETARVAKNLTFSMAEYRDRLSRVRAQMAERRNRNQHRPAGFALPARPQDGRRIRPVRLYQ